MWTLVSFPIPVFALAMLSFSFIFHSFIQFCVLEEYSRSGFCNTCQTGNSLLFSPSFANGEKVDIPPISNFTLRGVLEANGRGIGRTSKLNLPSLVLLLPSLRAYTNEPISMVTQQRRWCSIHQ